MFMHEYLMNMYEYVPHKMYDFGAWCASLVKGFTLLYVEKPRPKVSNPIRIYYNFSKQS